MLAHAAHAVASYMSFDHKLMAHDCHVGKRPGIPNSHDEAGNHLQELPKAAKRPGPSGKRAQPHGLQSTSGLGTKWRIQKS